MRRLVLAAFLVMVAGQAQAAGASVPGSAFEPGSHLLDACSAPEGDLGRWGVCAGYVLGVQDSHTHFVRNGLFQPFYCMPEGVTAGQLQLVVKKWLQEHPEDLHYGASGLAVAAFMKAFPCK